MKITLVLVHDVLKCNVLLSRQDVNTQILTGSSEWFLRSYISSKLPGDADAVDPETTLWEQGLVHLRATEVNASQDTPEWNQT